MTHFSEAGESAIFRLRATRKPRKVSAKDLTLAKLRLANLEADRKVVSDALYRALCELGIRIDSEGE